ILRTLFLFFLVFFFARPVLLPNRIFSNKNEAITVVILMDVSASMGMGVGGRDVVSVAGDQAQALIRKFSNDVKVGLIGFSDRVEEEVSPTLERSSLSLAIHSLKWKPRPTNIYPALELAYKMLGNQSSGQKSILVVSDMARGGWKQFLEQQGRIEGFDPDVSLFLWEVVSNQENVGISDASLQLTEEGVLKGGWLLNKSGSQNLEPVWSCRLNDRTVAQGKINLEMKSGASVPVEAQLPEGGFFSGQIELTPDSLPFDDVFYLAGRVPKGFRVLMVDGEGGLAASDSETYYLKLALETPRDPRLELLKVIRPELLNQEQLNQYEVVILANVGDLGLMEPNLVQWVERGGGLFISAGPNWPKAPYSPFKLIRTKPLTIKNQSLKAPQGQGPKFLNISGLETFEWGQVKIHEYRPIEMDSSLTPLIQMEDGEPLLVKKQIGKGSVR
ncbi:MAG: VWA domain-containing protein, partial [Elusimicrobia bacterium]|nr:VWA domain-containing protein [Candidatus Obscuribacterium magneticum]